MQREVIRMVGIKTNSLPNKLMLLGSPNRIDDDSDSKAVDFDRRITTIRMSTISIESTIAISIQYRSIFDIYPL